MTNRQAYNVRVLWYVLHSHKKWKEVGVWPSSLGWPERLWYYWSRQYAASPQQNLEKRVKQNDYVEQEDYVDQEKDNEQWDILDQEIVLICWINIEQKDFEEKKDAIKQEHYIST